ncbi:MAG: tRNA lysidine(34) synthetase TilS [Woeseiaceae bacterium]|nr:tRNA lysidine(34) synthetase TilS [Woeseiaceae bacterium]
MLSEFEKKVAGFLQANELVGSAAKLLLAVSGGADSTALLHAMYSLRAENVFTAELLCAHMNHQLRAGDADLDQEFVVAQAARLKLPVTTRRLDVRGYSRRNKLSIETAARQLRIEALSDIAKTCNCDAIVTAHQKNDNAETLLQRLTRGTGFRGLAGIWPARVFADGTRFVRPLLCVGRDEIVRYLRERNLEWRQNHTNADCAYRRNYIRHRLLPEVQRHCADSVAEQLFELAQSARKFHASVCASAEELWPDLAETQGGEITLDLKIFLHESPPVKVELIRRSLARLGCGERDLTRRHYESIQQLAEQNVTGRKMELPGGFVVCREYGSLIFGSRPERSVGQAPPYVDKQSDEPVTLNVPGQTRFGEYLMEATILDAGCSIPDARRRGKTRIENRESIIQLVERFDLDLVRLPLIVRPRRPGDRFVPLGLTSEKKIGKFLTAQRVPRRMRKGVLIVAGAEKIIWVWPVRMSEQAKVTADTRTILQLQMADLNDRQNSVDTTGPGQ